MASTSTLPAQSAGATVDQMTDILRRLGDLSAYIPRVADDGTITLISFSGQPFCTTLPPPTIGGISVDDDRLATAILAIQTLNNAIDRDIAQEYDNLMAACLDPDTFEVDQDLTDRVAQEPQSADEPALPGGTLERLGPERIKLQIADMRRELADLSQRIDRIEDDLKEGRIVYLFDDIAFHTLGEEPASTGLEDKIADRERFGQAEDALKLMNTGYRAGGFRWERSRREAASAAAS